MTKVKSVQRRFLEFLEDPTSYPSMSVSKFLTTEFIRPGFDEVRHMGDHTDKAYVFINELEKRGYILNDWFLFEEPLHSGASDKSFIWFDNYPLMVDITLTGRDYLHQQRLNDSALASDRILRWNFWSTLISSALTAIIALAGSYLSYLAFQESKSASQQVEQLRRKIETVLKTKEETEIRTLALPIPKRAPVDLSLGQPPSSLDTGRTTSRK